MVTDPVAGIWGLLAALALAGLAWHAGRFVWLRRALRRWGRSGVNGDVRYAGARRVRAEAYRTLLKAILLAIGLARWTEAEGTALVTWQDWVALGGYAALLLVLTAWSLATEFVERRRA